MRSDKQGLAPTGRPTRATSIEKETASIIWEAGFNAAHAWHEQKRTLSGSVLLPAPPNPFIKGERVPHDYDDLAVSRFALVMMQRLAVKRGEGASGWDDPKTPERVLWDGLNKAFQLRRLVDLANYAMFLYERGRAS